MIGQDAVATAEAFRDGVGFTGVVLTKLDGDARGGAALSVRQVTGAPIMFASTGEKLADFDTFHPDRMASRILGMGDMLTLIEQAENVFEADQAEEMAAKLAGNDFTLDDFLQQMMMIRKMGPIGGILGMLPGAGQMKEALAERRRPGHRPHRGDHPVHDAGRADRPEDHQRVPPAAHRQGLGVHRRAGQCVGGQVLRGPQDDVVDGRPVRSAGRPAVEPQGRQGPERQALDRARPDAAEGEGDARGFPGMGGMPPGMGGMPAGMGGAPGGKPGSCPAASASTSCRPGFDPSQLKFPKK